MQTAAIYLALCGLMAWAWPHSRGLIMPALAVNFTATALVGWIVSRAPDRDVCMIMCDFALVYFIRFQCDGFRRYFVGLVGMAAIIWRTIHIGGAALNPWAYAAFLNVAFAAQVAIAGGAGDGLGTWADDRLGRIWPRWSSLLRNVAG